jgi:RNA-directed DNA polymerase
MRGWRFAKTHKCTYSRYADDLTFSTSKRDFPPELAFPTPGGPQWVLGDPLRDKIQHSGFQINDRKTRMQVRGSRQVTTGLMVNEKVNIRREYYLTARAMCHNLFVSGIYYRVTPAALTGAAPGDNPKTEIITSLDPLEGVLQHIYQVRNYSDRRNSVEKKQEKTATATRKLYHRFLFYKHFVALNRPLILPEGKTDTAYLKCAIEQLPAFQPALGVITAGKLISNVSFMKYADKHTGPVHDILQLGGGTGDLKFFIINYARMMKSYRHLPCLYPVIIVVDNDKGGGELFGPVKDIGKTVITYSSTDSFYYIGLNLYLVKTPETPPKHMSRIEDLFDPALLKVPLAGKSFDPDRKKDDVGTYGKQYFAEHIVKPQAAAINFSGFTPLLDRIVAVIENYKMKLAALSTTGVVV